MNTAETLFKRFSTPRLLEGAVISGRYVWPDGALRRQFEGTPIASALSQSKRQPDGNILVDDFHQELNETMGYLYGDRPELKPLFSDEIIAERGESVSKAALAVKELVRRTRRDLIRQGDEDSVSILGFDLTLIPEIPEGVFFIKESGVDKNDVDGVTIGSIEYEQWTMVDTRLGKQERLLFMGIVDNRTDDGEGYVQKEFHREYWVIPEPSYFKPGELQPKLGQRTGEIVPNVPHIFGHLPVEAVAVPNLSTGRRDR